MHLRVIYILFLLALLTSTASSDLEIDSGDTVNVSTGAEIKWNSSTVMESDSFNYSNNELIIGKNNSKDVTYSIQSNSTERVNLTIFNQNFYKIPDPGDKVLDFEASATSESEVFFSFGGLPVVSSGQYRSFFGLDELSRSNNDTISWTFTNWSTKTFSVEHNRTDLVVENVSYSVSQTVQNQEVKFIANISNPGSENLTSNFNFTERKYNGSDFVFNDSQLKTAEIKRDSSKLVNFTFTAGIGLYNYSIESDTENEISETNESNNFRSKEFEVSSYQIFYGDMNLVYKLGSSESSASINDWNREMPSGNLYYADEEASYSLENLMPLNESGDLSDADTALRISSNPDSMVKTYDANDDGFADETKCYSIIDRNVCDVPVVNSTNSSNFVTGILYDSDDGMGYDGSQDLIFVTEAYNETRQGFYGEYVYESRVPSTLSNQVIDGSFIKYRLEFN